MIKRMTKITSLLVCAASIVSIIPAYAADVKKIDSQDGTIYDARAKGKAIFIDGEINGKDEAQYWMTDDGKYNAVSGLSDGMLSNDLLLNKYFEMDDQNTYFDITDNYKVIDDTVRANLQDDVATTLRKKVKADDDGRFSDKDKSFTTTTKFSDAGSGLSAYSYTLKSPVSVTGKTTETVYVDYAGNYVDADYNLGSLKVATTNSSVYIKNTNDTYDLKDGSTTYELKAVINDSSYITVISDVVYRWANLSIYKKVKGADDSTYTNCTGVYSLGGKYTPNKYTNSAVTYVPVLQSFTKATATDAVDGIKYAKDSTIYFCTDEDGKPENPLGKSVTDAHTALGNSVSGSVKITGDATGFVSAFLDTTANNQKLYAQTLKLKSNNGLNYLDLSSNDSMDVADNYKIQTGSGTLWGLGKGYIEQWDKSADNFAKTYKVDGSFNALSVSGKDNMIAWNQDDKVYSVIHNAAPAKDAAATTGTTTATGTAATTGTTATTTAASGWVKATDGTWSYNKAGGVKATGWLQDGATWYYLNATGVMQTGWINDNGTWYYCNGSGAMLANTTVDGYVLGASGAWIK